MTEELPIGWQWVAVRDVASYVRGVTYQKEHARSEPGEGLVPVLRANNIGSGLNFEDLVYVPSRFVSKEQRVRDGDVVIAMSSGSKSVVGKAAKAINPPEIGFGAFCGVLRPRAQIEASYLGFYFRTKTYRNRVSELSKGVNINNLKAEHLLDQTFPLPPADEQRRIASRIEELFSEIDEGERALERVQKLAGRYRQAVLKAAVTGNLTKSADDVCSADRRMKALAVARRTLCEAEGPGSRYREPSPVSVSLDLPTLPAGWIWASVDQIGLVSGGLTKNRGRAKREQTRPFLRVANVYANRLNLNEVHEIGVSDAELPRVTLKKGDLLVVEGNGSVDQIGRVALWDGSIPDCVHQNHLIKVRCTGSVPAWYVLVWFLSPLGRKYIEQAASSSSGLHTLSISKIQSLPIPVPPHTLLAHIRDEFDRMDSMTGSLASSVRDEAARADALRQAVLKAAFSGQLVPQDLTDEPASALLARLAGQTADKPASPHRRGRKVPA